MNNRKVFADLQPTGYKVSRKLSSGMPDTQTCQMSPGWSTIRILTYIDVIEDRETLAVLEGAVNGVHVRVGLGGVELHVHSRSLYSQIQVLLDAHELAFDPDVVIYVGGAVELNTQASH